MTRRGRTGGSLEERLAAGDVALPPVVALAGPEALLQDRALAAILRAAFGDPDSPHATVLHGPVRAGEPDAPTAADVLSEVRTADLFAPGHRKVVVLRRADGVVNDGAEPLLAHAARAAGEGVLVVLLSAAPADRQAPRGVRRFLEELGRTGAVIPCVAPSGEPPRGGGPSPLARWLAARAAERGRTLSPADADLLVHRSGTNLAVLDAALAAAALHARDGGRITAGDLDAVAPRGPAEAVERFVEGALAKDGAEALRVAAGLYREGALPYGAKSPTRGETPVTFLLLAQLRRMARDVRRALADRAAGAAGPLPPSLRFGCRDGAAVVRASTPASVDRLLRALTRFETELKSGVSGGERARLEALVLAHAAAP